MKPRIFICSPYSGDVSLNMNYLARCMWDSFERGEAPFASHGLYPSYLDDDKKLDRVLGMACGHAWLEMAFKCAVYEDRGISSGMVEDMKAAAKMNVIIEYRRLNA